VVIKIQNKLRRRSHRRGSMTLQFLVILVPVIFGFMGFALDLGRIYLVRGELNQAATAMALAAAAKLNGTTSATDFATGAANATLDDSLGAANKYNWGSIVVGQGDALLTSTVAAPGFFATAADALASAGAGGANTAGGTTAHHVTINLSADAPLLFWSLFTFGQARKTPIAATAVAGWSAPVCTACAIEPFAIPAVNAADAQDFGFVSGSLYTLGFQCTGAPVPALLAGTTARLQYLLIDRFDTGSANTEDQQLYRVGAQGLIPSSNAALACARIGAAENIWASAAPRTCAASAGTPGASVEDAMCGLATRLTGDVPAACSNVADVTTLAANYSVDADTTAITDYTTYQGNNRRLMTLPVVDALSTTGAMTVLGFRQFLFEPTSGAAANTPADGDSRFIAMYVGSVAPVKQGRFDGACGVTSGPGKVVLNQ
jgi:Flp pilus assembly protein TadG